jgi:hypothetical protein
MKITKELLKQIIKEEILKERKLREEFAFKAEDTPQEPPRFKAEDTPQEPSYKEIPKFPTSLHGKTVDAQLSGNTISFKTDEGNFKLEVDGRGVRGRMGISFTITPELKISSSDKFINGRKILKILMSK